MAGLEHSPFPVALPPAPPRRFSLARALLLGGCLACALGGLGLLAVGLHALFSELPCGSWSPERCAFEQELVRTMGRRQALAGAALGLLSLSLLLLLRASLRPEGPDEAE